MTPRLRRALTAVPTTAAAVALVLAATGPAQAATERHDDPARDSVKSTDGSEFAPSPQKFGDIVRLVTKHGRDSVTLTTTFRAIASAPVGLTDRIVTPDDSYLVQYSAIFGDPAVTMQDGDGNMIWCSDLTYTVSESKDLIRFVVPRSCLGDPDTVRTGSQSFVPAADQGTRAGKLFVPAIDDARRDGTVGNRIKVGPKVARG